MNRLAARAASTLALAALAAVAVLYAPSSSAIIAGTAAHRTPWAVQLRLTRDDGVYGCTGEQLDTSWILTARHCVDGVATMVAYQSNLTTRLGPAHRADRVLAAPAGDLGLVHLAAPSPVATYATLNLQPITARSSGTGSIMGYGLRAQGRRATRLYSASVTLTGSHKDAFHGSGQHVTGRTGAANHGDSGGPLLVRGKVIAVCSTGDKADPGADPHAGATYALVAQDSAWIAQTIGR